MIGLCTYDEPLDGLPMNTPCIHMNADPATCKGWLLVIVSSSTIEKIYEITLFTKIGAKSALFMKIGMKFS